MSSTSLLLQDVRYCQGMNFVAGTFIRVFGAEAEVKIVDGLAEDEVTAYHISHQTDRQNCPLI
eukprot:4615347-Amphidinium_carterae.1